MQADTIVPEPSNPQSLNRYAYVYNSPLRYADPTGHLSAEEIMQLLGAASWDDVVTEFHLGGQSANRGGLLAMLHKLRGPRRISRYDALVIGHSGRQLNRTERTRIGTVDYGHR